MAMMHQRHRRTRRARLALLSISLLTALSLAGPVFAARLRVVATTTDVAAVFRAVGGEDGEVETIARGYQDPHYLEAKPSYIVKLRKADALAYIGLELEVGWLPLLIEGARNDELLLGRRGNIPMSVGIDVLEIPTGEVSRAEGDIHPLGKPH
jgi:zinc/manganese transport system substrate-binding protein